MRLSKLTGDGEGDQKTKMNWICLVNMSNPARVLVGRKIVLERVYGFQHQGHMNWTWGGEWLTEGNPGMTTNRVKECWVAETTDVILYSVILLPRPWEPPLENWDWSHKVPWASDLGLAPKMQSFPGANSVHTQHQVGCFHSPFCCSVLSESFWLWLLKL